MFNRAGLVNVSLMFCLQATLSISNIQSIHVLCQLNLNKYTGNYNVMYTDTSKLNSLTKNDST